MARKIILLDRVGGPADFRVAFWLDVPAARQAFYANPTATSAVVGITTPELDAIKAGAIVEHVAPVLRDNGVTIGALRTILEAEYARLQTELTASVQWSRYGTSWDGTTWTVVTVA